jgi:hypothetical protein
VHQDVWKRKMLREFWRISMMGQLKVILSCKMTTHKVLRTRYYIPTLFRDAHNSIRKCKTCQLSAERENKASIPLQPITINRPFE